MKAVTERGGGAAYPWRTGRTSSLSPPPPPAASSWRAARGGTHCQLGEAESDIESWAEPGPEPADTVVCSVRVVVAVVVKEGEWWKWRARGEREQAKVFLVRVCRCLYPRAAQGESEGERGRAVEADEAKVAHARVLRRPLARGTATE